MSNNKVIPLGKKTSGAIEYFGVQSGLTYIIVKKDSTVAANIVYGYVTYKTVALYNAAWVAPAGETYTNPIGNSVAELDLQYILPVALSVIATISGAITLSSTQRVDSRTVVSTPGAGSVPAGARYVTIELSSDFDGTLDTDSTATGMLTPGGSYTWPVLQNDDTHGQIDYSITTGKIAIQKSV